MIFYIGADHKGFKLKEDLKNFLTDRGYQVEDCGNTIYDVNDSYPLFASEVAKKILANYENARGILICGSGIGMEMAANKFKKIRAGLGINPNHAFDIKNDDHVNILVLAADYTSTDTAKKILLTWLETPFSNESRHLERLKQISLIEQETMKDVGI